MNDKYILILGLFAAFCTTFAWIPQIVRILKVKETRDLSLVTYLMITVWVFAWFIYWILISDYPLIIANAIWFIINITITIMKIIYK